MRILLLHGQGYYFTNWGSLPQRLAKYGTVSNHSWDDSKVIDHVNTEAMKIVIIGHSLGANQLGWISKYTRCSVDLGVAYDPSRYSPLAKEGPDGRFYQSAIRFQRLLCYHNAGAWFFGGSLYEGHNVELTTVNTFHLGITMNEALHAKTEAAVAALSMS